MDQKNSGSDDAYEILRSIRQIVRAVSLHSRRLSSRAGLTVPQLLCLKAIAEAQGQEITASALARQIQVSPGTVTGITDRLVKLGLVARRRRADDRRRVYLTLTDDGQRQHSQAPKPLQEQFIERLGTLDPGERDAILGALQRVVELMGAEDIEASPILAPGGKLPATGSH